MIRFCSSFTKRTEHIGASIPRFCISWNMSTITSRMSSLPRIDSTSALIRSTTLSRSSWRRFSSTRLKPRKRISDEPLEAAAIEYDRELESLNPLFDLCDIARERRAFTVEERVEARRLIGEALEADRKAIAQIEAALKILDKS